MRLELAITDNEGKLTHHEFGYYDSLLSFVVTRAEDEAMLLNKSQSLTMEGGSDLFESFVSLDSVSNGFDFDPSVSSWANASIDHKVINSPLATNKKNDIITRIKKALRYG